MQLDFGTFNFKTVYDVLLPTPHYLFYRFLRHVLLALATVNVSLGSVKILMSCWRVRVVPLF